MAAGFPNQPLSCRSLVFRSASPRARAKIDASNCGARVASSSQKNLIQTPQPLPSFPFPFRFFFSFFPYTAIMSEDTGPTASIRGPNRYRAQRPWPPDFSKMDPKQQFRLERRYRRRTKLAYTRPKWTKAVKLVQFGSVLCMHGRRPGGAEGC
jgi:hypothetical protein